MEFQFYSKGLATVSLFNARKTKAITQLNSFSPFFIDCVSPEINFEDKCANAFPDANLDPSQPEEAQAFCQNNMLLEGQVMINSSGTFFFLILPI